MSPATATDSLVWRATAKDALANAAIYKAVILSDAPVGYWRLDDVGNVAADSSGNGHAGAINGYADLVKSKNVNLVGYWRLEEAAGLVAADSSTANHPGAISAGGIVKGVAGPLLDPDSAMTFDGVTGDISVPDFAAIDFTAAFTLELWLKTTSVAATSVLGKFTAAPSGWDLSFNSKLRMIIRGTSTIDTFYTGPLLNDGAWHHAVFVCQPNGITYYLDGAFVSTTAGTWTPTTNAIPFHIGTRDGGANGGFFPGSLDEVAVYNVVLTAAEVLAHYQAGVVTRSVTRGVAGLLGEANTAMSFVRNAGGIINGTGAIAGAGQITMEAWINLADLSNESVICGATQGANSIFLSITGGGSLHLRISDAGAFQDLTSANGLVVPGVPHHVVGTYDGVNMALYLDGALVAGPTASAHWITPNNTWTIGGRGGFSLNFAGTIDEHALYGVALTPAQIRNHYNAGKALIGALATAKDQAA